jgi:hypothetical protein
MACVWRQAAVFSGSLVALILSGCSDGNELGRLPIEGTVTFQGQPLDHGTVQFHPQDAVKGVQSGAQVKQGEFSIAEKQGLPPGSYRVMVFSADESSSAESPDAPPSERQGPPPKERIPADYNRNSKVLVEVKADADNRFDFTIQ